MYRIYVWGVSIYTNANSPPCWQKLFTLTTLTMTESVAWRVRQVA